MSDLVITSRPLLSSLMRQIEPYVIFKKEHVGRALELLALIRPRMEAEEFMQVVRSADSFASLNYSKTKRITAVDVEQHLSSKGLLVPVSTSSIPAIEEMGFSALNGKSMDPITRRPPEKG